MSPNYAFRYVIKQQEKPVFFRMFYNVTRYNNWLGTYFRQILNQQVLTHRMIPSLANLVDGNRLLFGDFPTRVIKLSNKLHGGAYYVVINSK